LPCYQTLNSLFILRLLSSSLLQVKKAGGGAKANTGKLENGASGFD
jgi:hypothetical protein